MDWPTLIPLLVVTLTGQGVLQFFSERRMRSATADSTSVQASAAAVDLAVKMMERLERELQDSKRVQALLIDYVKDLRSDMVAGGIAATPIPKELRETVI